jgi:hypothetical protein
MKVIILIAILSGLLVTELKEFVLIGGFANTTSLLKILSIMFILSLMIGLMFYPELLTNRLKRYYKDREVNRNERFIQLDEDNNSNFSKTEDYSKFKFNILLRLKVILSIKDLFFGTIATHREK